MKRVVVTGIGAVTPLGNSFVESWNVLKQGISGIAPITRFDASAIKWKVAGEVKGFDAGQYLSQKEISHLDPFIHYAVAAAFMAVEDAGLLQVQSSKFKVQSLKTQNKNSSLVTRHSLLDSAGIIIGSSRGGISTIERSLANSYQLSAKKLSPYLMPSTSINMAASYVAQKLGIKGYCLGISNACASGANAIGEAYRLIKSGYNSPVLAGGTEAPVCRLCLEGYGVSGALSIIDDYSASRPFDRTRDGFVLSEGACVLVLEGYESAKKRDARIYGEIVGYGNTTDAFHLTKPNPNGEAMAIKGAIKEACISPKDVDYISAHGTSTKLGDKAETDAIKIAFGKRAYEIPVSSIKSMTGHMLAASGAFEAASTVISIYEGIITPTINLKDKDPECDLNFVTRTTKSDIKIAISNSFGFGGVNAILVFKKV
jgi:3-oxoacyl-[acyl-carrier-protein] synthase II